MIEKDDDDGTVPLLYVFIKNATKGEYTEVEVTVDKFIERTQCRRKSSKKLPYQKRRGGNHSSSFVMVIALTMPTPRYVCYRTRPFSFL